MLCLDFSSATDSGGLPAELYLSPKAAEEEARMADDPTVDIDPEAFPDEDRENS